MNIWLITVGEPILIDGSDVRLLRSGLLCNKIMENNNRVTFFNSTFNHITKKHRFSKNTLIKHNSQLDYVLLKSTGYKNNISVSRLIDHFLLARNFKRTIENLQKPDLIFCSMPTIELAYYSVKFAKKNNIPVIVDVRDLWPDIFYKNERNFFKRKITQIIFFPSRLRLKYVFSNCNSIISITNSILIWAKSKVTKNISIKDDFFTLSNEYLIPNKSDEKIAKLFWDNLGITNDKNDFNVCLFASLGNVIDVETIIKSSEILNSQGINVRFIICGNGLRYEHYKNITRSNPNIVLPGWVNKYQIFELMQRSHFGILPYKNHFDFRLSIPNKVIEYLSQGLPILSCLTGEVEILFNKYNCGVIYKEGDHFDLAEKVKVQKINYNEMNYKRNCSQVYNTIYHPHIVYNDMYNHLIEIKNIHNDRK